MRVDSVLKNHGVGNERSKIPIFIPGKFTIGYFSVVGAGSNWTDSPRLAMNGEGEVSVEFTLSQNYISTAYAQLYFNGKELGPLRIVEREGSSTYTHTVEVSKGDTFSIKVRNSSATQGTARVDFEIRIGNDPQYVKEIK